MPHLPELIALSASSPFWRREPTGLACVRQLVFASFPRSGLPPSFASFDEYAQVVGTLQATGCIDDYTHIWWEIRPHPRLGTIEVRVMDAVPRLDDAVALAAYVQTLVKLYADRYDAGEARPRHHRALVAENRWRAARFGLDAELIDLDGREPIRVPVAEIVRRTLAEVDADARSLGCEEELVGIERILREGNGAQRQLGVNAGCLDLVEVTRDLAATTASESALTRT